MDLVKASSCPRSLNIVPHCIHSSRCCPAFIPSRHLRHGLLVVEAALVLLSEYDVRRLLVEPDAEAVELLLDDFLVRHALLRRAQQELIGAITTHVPPWLTGEQGGYENFGQPAS